MTPEIMVFSEFTVAFALIALMKIVCFILGYLMIRLGHDLLSSGIKGEFKFSGSLMGAKADLASVSPGLLFVLLGAALIVIALRIEKTVTGVYVNQLAKATAPAPDIPFPSNLPPFATPVPKGGTRK
jgi:hypothetical protein